VLPPTDLSQIFLCGGAGGSRRDFTRVADRDPDRRHPLATFSEVALDRERPLTFSDDDEEALQLGVASQIPTIVWCGY
jgi:hypothetical protein